MLKSLAEMRVGERGVVKEFEGGLGMAKRLQSMGVRLGKKIKKSGGHLKRGPQTVFVDNFKIAVGFGMATRILVEVEKDGDK